MSLDSATEYLKQFGVEDDSTEQKDLELLCKYQDNLLGEYKEFSKEEIERLEELQTEEYRIHMLLEIRHVN